MPRTRAKPLPLLALCVALMASVTTGCASSGRASLAATATLAPTTLPTPATPVRTPTAGTPPHQYTAHVVLRGGHPDDLAFDRQGHLLVSDIAAGTISRLDADGSASVVLRGVSGPEGIVVLADGTLLIAEQNTNRILKLSPGASASTVLRALPGSNGTASCKQGVDGLGFDAATQTLIVPDSPTGVVYRLTTDGTSLTQIASGISRPVGAAADTQGTIYVADECGGALWRITPGGQAARIGGFGMPDDVAVDAQGDVLVTDLGGAVHALLRLDRASGQRETLAQRGLIEPQGLAVDAQGDIFLADEAAQQVIEYMPASSG